MKNKGFSLVELIVVIAIMAILVGVAVPVYSSYIEKANAAKDEQLLGEINSAFAVVCAGNAIDINTVTDATIDIDVDASIPDSYVRSQSEKLRLYREIGAMRSDDQYAAFAARLEDRFGELPEPVRVLIDVVKLRREAINLGIEHVKVKNGLMIVRFVGDNNSPFFKTDTFLDMLRMVVAQPDRFVVKQYNNRLSMTVRKIYSVAEGVDMLRTLASASKVNG